MRPNFSEGRQYEVLDGFAPAITAVPGGLGFGAKYGTPGQVGTTCSYLGNPFNRRNRP